MATSILCLTMMSIILCIAAALNKICVVGCGVGGLTLGLALKKMCPSIEVTMVDARADVLQSETGGGLQISVGATILKQLKAYSNLASHGLPLRRIRARNERFDELLSIDLQPAQAANANPAAFTIMRDALISMMYNLTTLDDGNNDKLKPRISITGRLRCSAVVEDSVANKVGLTFEDGSILDNYDLVIGADGVSSTVRSYIDAANDKFSLRRPADRSADRTGLRITYCVTPPTNSIVLKSKPDLNELRKGNRDALHQWFGDGTYALAGSYGGLQGVQHMLAVVYRSSETASLEQNADWEVTRTRALRDDMLRRLQQAGLGDNAELLSLLGASTLPGGRTIDLPVRDSVVPLKSWSSASGRVMLLGDSAHPMSPFLGQGANQAMQDAYCLASLIREYNDQQITRSSTHLPLKNRSTLKRMALKYEAIRKLPTALVSVESRILGELETLSGPLGRVVKESFFRAMGATGIAKTVYMMGTVPRVGSKL